MPTLHCVAAEQFHAELEAVGRLAVLAQTLMAGGHALDPALFVEQHFGRTKAGEDLHAQALGMMRQPLHDVAQLHHIAAVVVQVARHEPVRHPAPAGFREEQHVVGRHRLEQRSAKLPPLRQQFGERARVHHRA
jgi:hypothetical protein